MEREDWKLDVDKPENPVVAAIPLMVSQQLVGQLVGWLQVSC